MAIATGFDTIGLKLHVLREAIVCVTHPVAAIALMLLALSACSDWQVKSGGVAGADIGALKTYRWYGERRIDSRLLGYLEAEKLEATMVRLIDEALLARGYQLGTTNAVDFQVNYAILLEESDEFMVSGQRGAAAADGRESLENIDHVIGQLVIDFLDPDDSSVIWRGFDRGPFPTRDSGASPQKREEFMRELVAAILDALPA